MWTVPGKPSRGGTEKEQLLRGAGRGCGEEDTEVTRRGDGWERGKWERLKIKAVRSFCVEQGPEEVDKHPAR